MLGIIKILGFVIGCLVLAYLMVLGGVWWLIRAVHKKLYPDQYQRAKKPNVNNRRAW